MNDPKERYGLTVGDFVLFKRKDKQAELHVVTGFISSPAVITREFLGDDNKPGESVVTVIDSAQFKECILPVPTLIAPKVIISPSKDDA